jgi:hypothetical protein
LEVATIGKALEGAIAARAKERQEAGSGNLPEGQKGPTRDESAKIFGTTGRTYEKAK